MKRIDFSNLRVKTDIAGTHIENVDKREEIANLLYQNGSGVKAHSLALRIYETNGFINISDEEYELITQFTEKMSPMWMNAIKEGFMEVRSAEVEVCLKADSLEEVEEE